jgi:plastocyanin
MRDGSMLRQHVIPWSMAAIVWLCAASLCAQQGAPDALGAIEGVVLYRADATRPWRYSRYYIKDPRQGQLAEAVIAISSPTLPPQPAGKLEPAVIDQKDFQFTPETIAIRAGQSVKFLNSDKELHNVNSFQPKHSFNVVMPAGGEHVEKFALAGGIARPHRIGCVYHSAMRSWIYVFDHPWYQVTAADGRFRLSGIPPGEYKLEMAHAAGQLRWSQRVVVKAGETVQAEIRVSPDHLPTKS